MGAIIINIKTKLQEQFSFWEHLDESARKMLTTQAKLVRYNPGENVRGLNNDPGILLVQSGLLRAYLLSEEGKIVTVHKSKPGDVCPLSALEVLHDVAFEIHMDAMEESEVIAMPTDTFKKLIEKSIYVENFLNAKAAQCLSRIIIAIEKMLFTSIDKRLTDFLFDESAERGSPEIRLTHEQIASAIGSAREVVSRALKKMADNGWVELSRGGIRILDESWLQQKYHSP